jgi:hypothetical protein
MERRLDHMSNLPLFVDRQVKQGEENRYRITQRTDGDVNIVFTGTIDTPGTRINAATLNPIVEHVNDPNIHVPISRVSSLETRIKTLEDALLNDFKNNIFNISFQTVDGVIVSRGGHDVANGRLVVK